MFKRVELIPLMEGQEELEEQEEELLEDSEGMEGMVGPPVAWDGQAHLNRERQVARL